MIANIAAWSFAKIAPVVPKFKRNVWFGSAASLVVMFVTTCTAFGDTFRIDT
jgi:hypothetical protein